MLRFKDEHEYQAFLMRTKRTTPARAVSKLPGPADILAIQLRDAGISFQVEFVFCDHRKWRSDFAIPAVEPWLLVECEGGIWKGGRHTRAKGFEADCEKYAEAMSLGYTVLRVTPRQILNMKALSWIQRLIKKRGT